MGKGLTTLRPRLRDRDPDGPALPADLLVALVPHLAPARLLHELDRHLAAAAAVRAVASPTTSSSPAASPAPRDAAGRAEEAPHDGAGLLLQGRGGGALLGLVGVELAQEGGGALGDEGLELGLGDVGEGEVQHLVSLRGDCGEVPVEENCVEDTWFCLVGVSLVL